MRTLIDDGLEDFELRRTNPLRGEKIHEYVFMSGIIYIR